MRDNDVQTAISQLLEPLHLRFERVVIFFVTKDPGITASTHLTADDGGSTLVVAFDLLLLDISRFTSQLEVSENGRAFVLVERAGESVSVAVVFDPENGSSAKEAEAMSAAFGTIASTTRINDLPLSVQTLAWTETAAVDAVVDATHRAGLARKVAKLAPMVCIKG